MTYRFLISICLLACTPLYSQIETAELPSHYYENIKSDSFRLFFNDLYQYTPEICATSFRYARIGADGHFNGSFEDHATSGALKGKGQYTNGIRQGEFEIYHANGNLSLKGQYNKDIPTGEWQYFYENGQPERTLKFTETDTLVIKFADKAGNITVFDGNGFFEGRVAGLPGSSNILIAKGKIKSGKPDGTWTSAYGAKKYCKESFQGGKFIRGEFYSGVLPAYKKKSILANPLLPNYLRILEQFNLVDCTLDSVHKAFKNKPLFDADKFLASLHRKTDEVIDRDIKQNNTAEYSLGDHYLIAKFSVNADGKPENIRIISAWGNQFESAIKTVIRNQTKFVPGLDRYFHLKMTISTGFLHQFSYQFSYSMTTNL